MTTSTASNVHEAMTAADRCDRCGAQAYVEFLVPTAIGDLPILMCVHHFRKHKPKITENAYTVHDETWRLQRDAS